MLVSVIIPTYNRARWLPTVLDSVMAQTYDNWECIVVDDGSTDDTSRVIRKYSDPRIQYHYTQHGERSAARNLGVDLSKGEFICFVDSDDRIEPGHLMCLVEGVRDSATVRIARSGYQVVHPDGTIVQSAFPAHTGVRDIWSTFHPVLSYFFHRSVFDSVRWPEKFWIWEDKHMLLRMVLAHKVLELGCHTAVVIDHPERSIHVVEPGHFEDKIWQIEHSVLDLWASHGEQLEASISGREMHDKIHDQLRGIAYDAIAAKKPQLARKALRAASRHVRFSTVPHHIYAWLKTLS